MGYQYRSAKEILDSSVAPKRGDVIAMFEQAGVKLEGVNSEPTTQDERWLLVVLDEVDSLTICVYAVPAAMFGTWRGAFERAKYLTPADGASDPDEQFASVRIANALHYHVADELVGYADAPGCPTRESLASERGAFDAVIARRIERDGVLDVTGLFDGPIVGVTTFTLYA